MIRAYGILNREVEADSPVHGIPYPGTFILDPTGRVTARFFEARYQERFTVSSIIAHLGDTLPARIPGVPGTSGDAEHLSVRTYASDTVAAPGNRLTLTVEVTPKPGMHVYAPGDHSYRVVRLRIDSPEFVVPEEPVYPESQLYYFEPLDETVPVYQEPFRLLQDVKVTMSREVAERAAGPETSFTVTGALEYQACDDQVCYIPAEILLRWELRWRPLVR